MLGIGATVGEGSELFDEVVVQVIEQLVGVESLDVRCDAGGGFGRCGDTVVASECEPIATGTDLFVEHFEQCCELSICANGDVHDLGAVGSEDMSGDVVC